MPRTSYKARREFAAELLEHAFFGAFYTAIATRKREESLTRKQLASRMGREKTGVSKLLSGPRNWQLSTIADLAEALGLRVEFSLVDRHLPIRHFTAVGVQYPGFVEAYPQSSPTINLSLLPGDNRALPAITDQNVPNKIPPPELRRLTSTEFTVA